MAHRPNILKLATKISLESLTYTGITYKDPEYRILEPIVDDDMCEIMMHLRLEANRTTEEVARRAKRDVDFTRTQLEKLRAAGVIRIRRVDGKDCWYYPIWVPGIMEGILSNREQCDKYPVLGECFEEYTRRRVSMLAPFMDVGMNMMRVIPVQSAIENNTRKASYDEVARLVENAWAISVGPCSCRRARRLMGEGCGHLEEDMCMYLNDNAVNYSETGAHRRITKEEAYEILKRAEANGLVHELNVAPGYEDTTAICNCCGCSCFALRIATYFRAPDAVRTNYIARVDKDKCTACGQCVENCQLNAVKLGQKLCPRPANEPRPEETPRNTLWTSKRFTPDFRTTRTDVMPEGTAPCKAACPAHVPVQGYIQLAKEGRYDEALALIKRYNPLPAVCGRICHRPCEKACLRGAVDEAVAIDDLKRFLAERDLNAESRYIPPLLNPRGVPYEEKIAVIGAGPAGLSCAYYLKQMGYPVTVFEKEAKPGGLLRTVHADRLPAQVLDAEIDVLRQMGVDFQTGVEVGKNLSLDELRAQGYRAFFLGVGAGAAELPQGLSPEKAMRQVNRERRPSLPGVDLTLTERGMVKVDAKTGQTSVEDIFAGGDVCGFGYSIHAIAAGKKAAESIHRYVHRGQTQLLGRDPGDYKAFARQSAQLPLAKLTATARQRPDEGGALSEEQVQAECGRCLGCGTAVVDSFMCVGCGICTTKCSFGAIRLEKIHDADNLEYFHTLGRIVASVPGKGVSIAKKHIGKYGADHA
ncbi:MAG: FAD-dependent oxidoreductase [Oscillospiraceae bacterium]|nr:FAD-dependent oxidoreductase [Oscillospiraceae bacterium]